MMTDQLSEPDWDNLFHEIRDEMLAWRRAHPKATLRDIELENQRVLARLHARMVQDLAAASAAAQVAGRAAEERLRCPDCQTPVVARGKRSRTLRSYGDQTLQIERDHATCPKCGRAFFPSG